MTEDLADADEVADLLLPLDGPYPPERVVETARTVAELIRRLNHATFNASALRYPAQLYRTVGALRSGLYGLQQTFNQLAARLDTFSADPRVGHDDNRDPAVACALAMADLYSAVDAIGPVTAQLDAAVQTTSHLHYEAHLRRRPAPAPVSPDGPHRTPRPTIPPPGADPLNQTDTTRRRRR